MYRQGDVLIRPIEPIPRAAKIIERAQRYIAAHGEATGHCHTIVCDEGELVIREDGGKVYVSIVSPAEITHQEHDTITLPVGDYQIVRQREYAPEGIRRVAD